MALLYKAELRPSKIELIEGWAPTQPWFEGNTGSSFASVGSFRFDDPDGEVGIETILVRVGEGPVLQVPLTYRGAPLAGGDAWLIGTMEHSVLGRRWVYDATGDPAYLAAVATAALTGGGQAKQYIEIGGVRVLRESTVDVAGSGKTDGPVPSLPSAGTVSTLYEFGATVIEAGALRIVVARRLAAQGPQPHGSNGLDALNNPGQAQILTGTWTNQPNPQKLVQAKVL
ncbi:hypothetical protein E3T28_04945 [Cryobacterium sinapicolor]|uniref:Maltokinase N-terminal cap domain-containing protein n=1 Tax=Cryobacterium sinapicolor TaxID=1259236 RepID=A0ABY2JFF3_9MICO|nr:hypothetical protein [Cryobacterium sinapicolor]TFD02739.1 hypothetical protein E3T28_04945 [Cryobacterium sinapicolor]